MVKRTVTERADGETITPSATKDQLKEALPDTVAGTAGKGQYQRTVDQIPVKIETERMSIDDTGPGDHYNYDYRPVPAGSNLVYDNDNGYYGSGCTTAYNDDASKYDLVSAGHIISTEKMYQNEVESDEKIGARRDNKVNDPDTADPAFDAGVIDLESDYTYKFAGDNGDDDYWDDRQVFGIVGRDKLKDNENSSFTIYKRGAKTGMKSGDLGDVYNDDHAFDTAADRDGGDSGGPHFTREYNNNHDIWEVYIAGVHYAGGSNHARATMMDEVESRYNLSI